MSLQLAVWPTEADWAIRTLVHAAVQQCLRLAGALQSPWTSPRTSLSCGPRLLSSSHGSQAADRTAPPRVRQADRARFQKFVLPHLDAAYSYARFLSRDAEGAQDVVQEAAMRAFRGFDGFQGGDARAWLFTIVRNCHYDRSLTLRRAARFEVSVEPPSDSGDDGPSDGGIGNLPSDEDTPEDALMRKDDVGRVRAVLVGLAESSREVLVLRELEALSYREIAAVVGIPIGTVMSRLSRARKEFADAWSASAGEQGSKP